MATQKQKAYMKNTMLITLAALAAFALVSRAQAESFKLDPYSLGGAVVGFGVGGPIGAGAGYYAGSKMGEHERQQDGSIVRTQDDLNTLGNYVASEPWKAKIRQLQQEPEQAASPKVEPQTDWRKACIPQGAGGLDLANR